MVEHASGSISRVLVKETVILKSSDPYVQGSVVCCIGLEVMASSRCVSRSRGTDMFLLNFDRLLFLLSVANEY